MTFVFVLFMLGPRLILPGVLISRGILLHVLLCLLCDRVVEGQITHPKRLKWLCFIIYIYMLFVYTHW